MYRWAPGKRTKVQTEPAPSDYVRPLEFDRIREGQNPPNSQVGVCDPLCKGLRARRLKYGWHYISTPLGFRRTVRKPLAYRYHNQ